MLVRRIAPLRDNAFPPFVARAFPRLRIVEGLDAVDGRLERECAQQRAALVERQLRHVAAVEPEDVEHVVRDLVFPRDFAVDDHIAHRQHRQRAGNRRDVLRQPVARQQADLRPLFEREQADAVEFSFEDPVRPGEPLLRQRCRHRHEPFGKGRRHLNDLSWCSI
jgi:hypothetical protein